METKDAVDLWLKGVGVSFTIIAVIGGLIQFTNLLHQRKVDATTEYVERYGEKEILEARLSLGAAWWRSREQLARLRRTQVTAEEYQLRHRQLVFSVVMPTTANGPSLVEEVSLLVAFFQELHVCVEHGLCDKEAAESFFGEDVRSFYCLYRPYIEWLSENFATRLGAGLIEGVKASVRCYDENSSRKI